MTDSINEEEYLQFRPSASWEVPNEAERIARSLGG